MIDLMHGRVCMEHMVKAVAVCRNVRILFCVVAVLFNLRDPQREVRKADGQTAQRGIQAP